MLFRSVPVAGLDDQWPVRQGMTQPQYASVANQFQYATYFAIRNHMLEQHGLQIDGACKDTAENWHVQTNGTAGIAMRQEPADTGQDFQKLKTADDLDRIQLAVPEDHKSSNASAYVRVYLKRGLITRGQCECCDSWKTQPHAGSAGRLSSTNSVAVSADWSMTVTQSRVGTWRAREFLARCPDWIGAASERCRNGCLEFTRHRLHLAIGRNPCG